MSASARLAGLARWCVAAVSRLRGWLGLTWRGLWALGAATLALGATVSVLGAVSEDVTQHDGLASPDVANLGFFTDHRSDLLVRAARILSDFGGVLSLIVLAIAAGLLLWRGGLPLVVAAAPAFALGVAAALGEVTKHVVDRARPGVGFRLVAVPEPSFPSGHATDSAALFLTLGLVLAVFVFRRPPARIAIVVGGGVIVTAIGVSRLVLGVHWPTEVLAGWALGAAAALSVTIGATFITRLVPRDPHSPEGRLRRVGLRLGHLLAAERPLVRRRGTLPAA